ncbi:hypothetical protein IW261DRAFT_219620 [Armillaria novae-zelandiae]|uniref:Mid2 domain-containing protein n=1 Tax=Armillaria novae-zelandiae TaxID=153914 RepID=A0AA39P666_9AGAR|nr:hypothetical protein IW261DRAFT_219620 [Armillaria novae-zelandiae]
MSSIRLYKITTFTLVICLVLALVVSSEASSHAGVVRRDHETLNRMIRKRAPAPQDNGGAASASATDSAEASTQSTSQAQSQQTSSSTTSSHSSIPPTTSTTPTSISTPSTTSTTPTSTSSTSSATSTSSSSSSSSSVSTTSSSSSTTSTSSTSVTSESTSSTEQTQQQQTTQDAASVTQGDTGNASHATITKTASVDETASAASASSSASASGSTSTSTKTAAITALIVVASSVGGIVILWTIFRKWKLGRSSTFDKRMQPIDWQPTTGDDGGVTGHHRATSDTSSFHSGLNHSNSLSGRSYNAASESGHGHGELGPLPEHDFTAPPANLAPVGGYADLARGPSPQPEMQETLARGPSMTRPVYDVSVPLHHQVGYGSQDAYDYSGGVPARY